MTRRQWWQCVGITVIVLMLLASSLVADEQSAEQARLDAGVAMSVAEFEKAQAVERSNGVPVFQDLEFVSGDYDFGIGDTYRGFGNIFFEAGNWEGAEEMFDLASDYYIWATGHYELAFPN